ncbi:SgcJ/EcaC family oxidoreductase [Arthrobacter sp. efr-133-TYG-118]|uniref:SgcJ/EcaC family oxidoreductase n=1 Tax=Arthrobacter sp. efr-133-TYG-118 TaxID=3040279 RepID=UPI00254F33F3|nr:SgcJ/EcaC family oxidoreductase [Arthrobacter sp. efr-133-TYG-118]
MSKNEPTNAQSEVTDEIRSLFGEIYAAWADNDADAFVAPYRDDATVVMPRTYHRDKEEIRSSMAAGFQGPLKGSQAVDEPLSIRVIGGHTAIVVSKAGILTAGEAQLPIDREVIATWVLVRQDGRWLVASYANAPAH